MGASFPSRIVFARNPASKREAFQRTRSSALTRDASACPHELAKFIKPDAKCLIFSRGCFSRNPAVQKFIKADFITFRGFDRQLGPE